MKPFYTKIVNNSHACNHHTWVCSLCYPFALEIGNIWGSGSLIYMMNLPLDTLAPREYSTGKFAILAGQGHRDDEILIFDERPSYSIDNEFKLAEFKPDNIKIDMDSAIHLYEMAKKVGGYNPEKDGGFQYFLIRKMHELIKRWEKKNGSVERFYKTFVEEREQYVIKKREAQNKEVIKKVGEI